MLAAIAHGESIKKPRAIPIRMARGFVLSVRFYTEPSML